MLAQEEKERVFRDDHPVSLSRDLSVASHLEASVSRVSSDHLDIASPAAFHESASRLESA